MKKWKPKKGERFFIPCFEWYMVDGNKPYLVSTWQDSIGDLCYYKQNFVCKTKTEAIALAKAMLKVAERRMK